MAPSKHWMSLVNERLNPEYEKGVRQFITFAFGRLGTENKVIKCPCVRCKNSNDHQYSAETIEDHLIAYGILSGYTFWCHHGEIAGENQLESESLPVHDGNEDEFNEIEAEENKIDDEIDAMLMERFQMFNDLCMGEVGVDSSRSIEFEKEANDEAKKFYRLLEDLQQPLYEGCKASKLSTVVKLLHIKSLGRWSNESFTMLLDFLKNELLPMDSLLPNSYYEAKKIIKDLGLSYTKIDACVNDCMLFWKDDETLDSCKWCHASRWKDDKHSGEIKTKKNGKKIPVKMLRYFPLKSRLQRLFMSSKTASHMRWHHECRVKDDSLRHPADAKGWKHFDETYKKFASEPRNVRLGLITDSFQPFSNATTPYSIWPVMLVPYNMPPWICMKQSNFILSMIIPGPDGPGDAIDVYLQPLIEELNELWEFGAETYDVSVGQNFNMHAALIGTINDFPAYGILSGWSTKGKLACPCCHKFTHSIRLPNSSKQAYMGHRRFLPKKHTWRKKKDWFGEIELRDAPVPLSGDDVLEQVKDLEGIPLSKAAHVKVKLSHEQRGDNWNKKSIFFKLAYWKTLLLRHNLDVMHIEKNVCDIILGTLMNMKGKTKDNVKSRLDLQALNMRPELHPRQKGNKLELPPAPYTLSRKQKQVLCEFLKGVKVSDGFSSNISRCINLKELKISGLKSHDCHILMQQLLPLVLRADIPNKEVSEALIELCTFFKVLCAKTLRVEDVEQIKAQAPKTLSKLEELLPPACWNVMLHLVIHLADQALISGPVQYHWMYSGERCLYVYKLLVGNKAHPEGCIAEGYIANECMTLCSRYLHSIETKFNRPERNYDGGVKFDRTLSVFAHPGRPVGAARYVDLDALERERAHVYALKNCEEVQSFFRY